jgi:LuxR family transcriptional regulator, maltose regulon positive regulatory protein
MNNRFLKTKFHIPLWRKSAVSRPRLLERLFSGVLEDRKLTLVSAPAGYGKTTLVAEWIQTLLNDHQADVRVAWVALDEGDNDPTRFLSYFVAALNSVDDTIGQGTPSLLGMPQLPPLPTILDELINDISTLEQQIILFLDDYHIITNRTLHEALEYFIEHQPASLHLAITTREDPPFSLGRMRARGQLTEIRAHDLRFTVAEAQQFFNQSMHLELNLETIQAVEARTEGWAVGLQLAALAMQNLSTQEDFLADFSGSHRYVIDYLLDEVLKHQPPEIADFLNKTAVLKRFNAELCEMVTGNSESASILSELERCNLFLIPLDNQRGWYRYHHLFADALSAGRSPAGERDIYIRAARWFEAQESLSEAISYWLAVHDTKEVERLLSRLAIDLIKHGELQTLLGWLNSLPAQVVEANSDLLSYKALTLLMTGQINPARDCVIKANHAFQGEAKNTGFGRLLAIQAWFSSVGGETQTGELAKAALEHLDESDLFFRIFAFVALGDHYAWNADLPSSSDVFREAWELGKQLHHPFITLAALVNLAFNLLDQGQLREAEALCRAALTEYVDQRGKQLPIVGMIYSPLATICYEKGDFEEAQFFAQTGSELCQRLFSSAMMGKDNEIVLARMAFQRGDVKQSFEIVQSTAEAGRQSNMMMIVAKMKIIQVELYLANGKLAEAAASLAELDVLAQSDLHKMEHVISHLRAIYRALSGEPVKALEILNRLEQENRAEGSVRRMIGVYITKALVYQTLSNHEQAKHNFVSAIRLAAPQGYKAAFFPRGNRQTRALLQATRSVAPTFVDSILEQVCPADDGPRNLPDPLSIQEIRVLNLLREGKSNQAIADELVISVGTAKWHVHNILQKMAVANRAQAIARAHELELP